MLPLVFGVAFTLLTGNLLSLDFPGQLEVSFDGRPLFITNGSSQVRTSMTLELPLLPGEHELLVNNQTLTYHLFDMECRTLGGVFCTFTAYENLTLPVSAVCGPSRLETNLKLIEGQLSTIEMSAVCQEASLQVGDWFSVLPVTPLFIDQIEEAGPGYVEVYVEGELILNKTVNDLARFPELREGVYDVELKGPLNMTAKLAINGPAMNGFKYVFAGLLSATVVALFIVG